MWLSRRTGVTAATGAMVVGKMVETGYRVQFSPISCAAANNERRMVDFKMSVCVSNGTDGVPVKGSQAWR